jgi:hypothetical protein
MEYKQFLGPGFETMIPTDWLISSTPRFQAIFTAPQRTGKGTANLMIRIEKAYKDYGLPELRKAIKDNIQSRGKNAETILEEETKLAGLPAFHGLYRIKPEKGKNTVLVRQMVCTDKTTMMLITASREAGEEPGLDEALGVIIGKIKFTG